MKVFASILGGFALGYLVAALVTAIKTKKAVESGQITVN